MCPVKINKEIPRFVKERLFFCCCLMNLKQKRVFFIAFLLYVPRKPIKIYIFYAIKYYDDDSKNLLFYASITFFIFILYYLMFPYTPRLIIIVIIVDLQQNKRQQTTVFCKKEHEPIKFERRWWKEEKSNKVNFIHFLLYASLFYYSFPIEKLSSLFYDRNFSFQ